MKNIIIIHAEFQFVCALVCMRWCVQVCLWRGVQTLTKFILLLLLGAVVAVVVLLVLFAPCLSAGIKM